jgi:hypothetical protein
MSDELNGSLSAHGGRAFPKMLLRFAQDHTSTKMLSVTAGPKLNRAEVREIGRWFEILADGSQASAGKAARGGGEDPDGPRSYLKRLQQLGEFTWR